MKLSKIQMKDIKLGKRFRDPIFSSLMLSMIDSMWSYLYNFLGYSKREAFWNYWDKSFYDEINFVEIIKNSLDNKE